MGISKATAAETPMVKSLGPETQDIEGLLKEGNPVRIRPQGYSMYPMLVPGRDEIILSALGEGKLRRGDVVLYRRPQGILVLHRIWKATPQGLYLVGDNQAAIEGPIALSEAKGILTAFLRNGRHIPVTNLFYRMLALLWLRLRPLRPGISRCAAYLKRKCKKIKR